MSQPARFSSRDDDFNARLDALIWHDSERAMDVEQQVSAIVDSVRRGGDTALIEATQRFDNRPTATIDDLRIDESQLQAAYAQLDPTLKAALEKAAERIRRYHEHQRESDWMTEEADGSRLGQRVSAIEAAGIYVPGGLAAYPSSVLMNAIPAQVAGVERIVMVSPAPSGQLNPVVLGAAAIAGVSEVYSIGGAQAIAALAWGTESIPRVDKIVGPGNIWVATAKRQVFGRVGIDMIAGPSEVLIIADSGADPDWLVYDLFAQAEHDELAQSILLSPDRELLDRVAARIPDLLASMPRKAIIAQSLATRGALIAVESLEQAAEIANRLAPEHLELQVADPEPLLEKIRHAGAVFMGYYSAEVFGDYCAGTNHVLPTAAAARFSSPLGVYDFMKKTSVLHLSRDGVRALAGTAAIIADAEGLHAHAAAARCRG
ncbi:histidinol dehydrogenase [Gammaproteobacteria bacterium]|nr:histidinol dehydrogenase [Gammaproteobacteria bacterium]